MQEPLVRLMRMRASQKRIDRSFKTNQRTKVATKISLRTDKTCSSWSYQAELGEAQPIRGRLASSGSPKKGVNEGFPAQKG